MKYNELDALLTGRNRKKLGNNTYALRKDGGVTLAIRLHETDILTFKPNGSVIVTSGGWKTYTTKIRLNGYLPHGYRIGQWRGVWFWHKYSKVMAVMFTDGDVISARGSLRAQAIGGQEKKDRAFRRQVNTYAKLKMRSRHRYLCPAEATAGIAT